MGFASAFYPPVVPVPGGGGKVGVEDRKQQMARQFIEAIPHSRALGMQLEEIGEGRIPFKGGYEAFEANRDRVSWAQWQGPAKPSADDLKSAKASSERLENGTSSIEVGVTTVLPRPMVTPRSAARGA